MVKDLQNGRGDTSVPSVTGRSCILFVTLSLVKKTQHENQKKDEIR